MEYDEIFKKYFKQNKILTLTASEAADEPILSGLEHTISSWMVRQLSHSAMNVNMKNDWKKKYLNYLNLEKHNKKLLTRWTRLGFEPRWDELRNARSNRWAITVDM